MLLNILRIVPSVRRYWINIAIITFDLTATFLSMIYVDTSGRICPFATTKRPIHEEL